MITISPIENRRISGTHWICIWARRANQIFTNFWILTNPILWKMFFNSIFIIKYQTSSKMFTFRKQFDVRYLLVTMGGFYILSPTSSQWWHRWLRWIRSNLYNKSWNRLFVRDSLDSENRVRLWKRYFYDFSREPGNTAPIWIKWFSVTCLRKKPVYIFKGKKMYQFLWSHFLQAMSTWSNLRHRHLQNHNLYSYRVCFQNHRSRSSKHCCTWKRVSKCCLLKITCW